PLRTGASIRSPAARSKRDQAVRRPWPSSKTPTSWPASPPPVLTALASSSASPPRQAIWKPTPAPSSQERAATGSSAMTCPTMYSDQTATPCSWSAPQGLRPGRASQRPTSPRPSPGGSLNISRTPN
ncbi:hypothetical protein LTR94_030677, partial [Friedmanniomyces endolithicus]